MTTHTPGPWIVERYNSTGEAVIESPKYGDIADIVYCRDVSIDEANARLIAAAPDLLAACERVRNGLDAGEHPGPFASILGAAIAKAKGNA